VARVCTRYVLSSFTLLTLMLTSEHVYAQQSHVTATYYSGQSFSQFPQHQMSGYPAAASQMWPSPVDLAMQSTSHTDVTVSSSVVAPEQRRRTVRMRGLPWTTNLHDILEFFRGYSVSEVWQSDGLWHRMVTHNRRTC
jgi:hypothetical protein